MKIKVTYKSGNERVLYGVTNEQMAKIKSNRNITRYEVIDYI